MKQDGNFGTMMLDGEQEEEIVHPERTAWTEQPGDSGIIMLDDDRDESRPVEEEPQ